MLERVRQLISKYRTKKRFLGRVAVHFALNSPSYVLIKKAYEIARIAFHGRKRDTGEAYFYHKLATAVIIMEYLKILDANLIAAALLHDIIEDIELWTESRVSGDFNPDVGSLVESVTKPNETFYGVNYHKHKLATFAKVRAGGVRACTLKVADRLHNMVTLWGSSEKKLAKTLETLRYVLPLAVETGVLWKELVEDCALQIHEQKIAETT